MKELVLDKTIYHKNALLKASYSFIDRVYIHLSQTDKNWTISWENRPGENVNPAEFENELIEQELRYQLLTDSSELRKILLARAMASTIIEKQMSNETKSIPSKDDSSILESWFTHESRSKT